MIPLESITNDFMISHRGNHIGRSSSENHPDLIEYMITLVDCEIDLWHINTFTTTPWYLGHDEPLYPITIDWLLERCHRLWVHAKSEETLAALAPFKEFVNYFWHIDAPVATTSHHFGWTCLTESVNSNTVLMCADNAWYYNEKNIGFYKVCSDHLVLK